MGITRHELGNGLRLVLSRDPRVPVVSVCVTYGVGSGHERPGRSGFAHLFEHMMFEGSVNVSKGEHFGLVESAGGQVEAYADRDYTNYIDTLPSHELELGLWLEADRMASLSSVLSQESLDTQRDIVKNERRAKIDNVPYGPAEDELFAMAFPPGHPYGHSMFGSMDDLEEASLDDVREFFTAYYTPNNAVLTMVGDFQADAATNLVERHFGPIPRGPEAPRVGDPPAPLPDGPIRRDVISEVPLPQLLVGCPIPTLGTDSFDVADLTVDLLVTGQASRLERRLVRETRLAQTVDAYAYPLVAGSAFVAFEITASEDAEPDKVEAVLGAELDRLGSEAPTDEEMARVRMGRETTHAVGMQQAEARSDRIGMYASLLDQPERFGTEGEIDSRITADAVRGLAREAFSAGNRASLWYLPADA